MRILRTGRLLLLASALLSPPPGAAEEWTGLNLRGQTGYVTVPTATPVPYKGVAFGVHRFTIGLLGGWPRNVEAGLSFDLREVTPITPFTRDTFRERAPHVNFHAKALLLSRANHMVDAAIGVWRHTYYLQIAPPKLGPVRVEAGPTLRRRSDDTHEPGWQGALGTGGDYHFFFADYDSQERNAGVGWRYLMSDQIRMDVFLSNVGKSGDALDRFSFGLTLMSLP